MKKTIITAILTLVLSGMSIAQTTTIKYYSDENLKKEVSIKKAKFSKTITQNADGSITTTTKNLKKDEIISSQTYKDNEPYGIWKIQTGSGVIDLNYDFNLEYTSIGCEESGHGITNYFQDNESLNYVAPKISSGQKNIMIYISQEMKYPPTAAEQGISGKVILQFDISAEGKIENIKVKKGVHIELDKESVRVVRELKFSSPPMLNGVAQQLCVMLPINYKIM